MGNSIGRRLDFTVEGCSALEIGPQPTHRMVRGYADSQYAWHPRDHLHIWFQQEKAASPAGSINAVSITYCIAAESKMDIVAEDHDLRILRLELGPYETNCYIVIDNHTKDSLIVDAPDEAEEILLRLRGTEPRLIALTHSHIDHIMALADLKKALGVPLAAHPLDAAGLPEIIDLAVEDGIYLHIGQLDVHVIHTPGHTPGSVCYQTGKNLLAGDTIFPGGPGHTNTPSDFAAVLQSIEKKVLTLPPDTLILPGHGKTTILSDEKKAILRFRAASHAPDLCGDVLWQ